MKHPSVLTLAAAFFVAVLLAGCADSQDAVPSDEQTRLARAYAELTFLSESARLGKITDTTRSYQAQADSVLRRYAFTKDEFEDAFRNASLDPDRSKALFDSATAYIRSRRDTSAAGR